MAINVRYYTIDVGVSVAIFSSSPLSALSRWWDLAVTIEQQSIARLRNRRGELIAQNEISPSNEIGRLLASRLACGDNSYVRDTLVKWGKTINYRQSSHEHYCRAHTVAYIFCIAPVIVKKLVPWLKVNEQILYSSIMREQNLMYQKDKHIFSNGI